PATSSFDAVCERPRASALLVSRRRSVTVGRCREASSELGHLRRLAQVVVQARSQEALPIAGHGVGGHGDDPGLAASLPLLADAAGPPPSARLVSLRVSL